MITINDKEYEVEDLTPEQQHLVAQVTVCRNKAQAAASEMQIAQIAEQQLTQALISSVEAPAEEEEAA